MRKKQRKEPIKTFENQDLKKVLTKAIMPNEKQAQLNT